MQAKLAKTAKKILQYPERLKGLSKMLSESIVRFCQVSTTKEITWLPVYWIVEYEVCRICPNYIHR